MDVLEAIKTRASTRAFLEKSVSDEIINKLLNIARWAPSGTNTQPWQVVVVQSEAKDKLCNSILTAFQNGEPSNPDYQYYPTKWTEPYKSRRFACGMALYENMKIDRKDKAARKKIWELNYVAFNAPVVLFFFIDKHLEKGSWFDYGMFFENVMLAAVGLGLATCPQAALSEYPDIVRNFLGENFIDKILISGMALGYADNAAQINSYRTERESVENFTTWIK